MRTLEWQAERGALRLIDQRALPAELRFVELTSADEVAQAIREMTVRGAPAIGVAAAFGLALAAQHSRAKSTPKLLSDLQSAAALLRAARPTAVNLGWAIDRTLHVAREAASRTPDEVRRRVLEEAQRLADEDVATNRRLSAYGADLVRDGDTIIHHCNTGALAVVDYGTALGVIRAAHEQGKRVHVLVDETRPRLQGARLTAWELGELGIPYEIIADGAAGHFLHRGEVQLVLVGGDRVAANGDVANKIGTYMLALAAQANRIPFYCVVPLSTIDRSCSDGSAIPIEERDPREVLELEVNGQRVTPRGAKARNPAFDVTPNELVTAWVTERGIVRAPFAANLARLVGQGEPA
ncbi:MAG: S-methyl-5-thioribose-1-phosphate isomerase [Chloroflexi bacterium]|nr:S-methyl-5-thioribose-1-phosphate isomerase [Chloroflexota bacterium]